MLKNIREFAWFLLKSPQRKWVGWGTLWVDVKGFWSRVFGKKTDEIIWICVGNYNRSEALLKHLVSSMSMLEEPYHFGLSIVDCGSADIVELENEIKKIWKGPLVFTKKEMSFSRAKVFNLAIKQAHGDNVFVADADMKLPINLAALFRKNVINNSAWFPICQWQIDDNRQDWRWFTEGTGIFGATKTQLQKGGYYNENITEWGKEDWELFFNFYKAGIAPYRSKCEGLYHSWHTPSKPADFVKMF